LSQLELRYLRLLLESRERIAQRGHFYDVHLEDFVLDLREDGASAHSIAEEAGVSPASVQKWTQHARVRRAELAQPGEQNEGEIAPG
jgi:transposase-like protein